MNIVVTVQATLGKRMRNARQLMSWVGWLFRLFGVFLVVSGLFGGDAFLLGLVFVVYPELIGLGRHLLARKYGPTFVYTLHGEGISVKTAISTLEISWTAIKKVRETAAEWVIRVPGGAVFSLPKTSISVSDDATLRDFLRNRELIRS